MIRILLYRCEKELIVVAVKNAACDAAACYYFSRLKAETGYRIALCTVPTSVEELIRTLGRT
ncbi:hypothetical protein Mapa_006814 [Marchantia paleacea]|nr:hypothetical protein Mapa_006814 [Marchantia paleacea]